MFQVTPTINWFVSSYPMAGAAGGRGAEVGSFVRISAVPNAARSRALSTFPAPPVSTRSQAPPKGRSHNYYKLETSLSPENRSIPLGYAEIEKDSV
jgi:hypothetical protein